MANKDVTITLAGQFSCPLLNARQQKMIEILGNYFTATNSGTTPTTAQWNTQIANAYAAMPTFLGNSDDAKNLLRGAIRAAIWWQTAAATNIVPVAVAAQSTTTLLTAATYLQGLDENTLEVLSLYLKGRTLGVLS